VSLKSIASTLSAIAAIGAVFWVYFEKSAAIAGNAVENAEQKQQIEKIAEGVEANSTSLGELINLQLRKEQKLADRHEQRVEMCQSGDIPKKTCREKYGIR